MHSSLQHCRLTTSPTPTKHKSTVPHDPTATARPAIAPLYWTSLADDLHLLYDSRPVLSLCDLSWPIWTILLLCRCWLGSTSYSQYIFLLHASLSLNPDQNVPSWNFSTSYYNYTYVDGTAWSNGHCAPCNLPALLNVLDGLFAPPRWFASCPIPMWFAFANLEVVVVV